MTSVRTLYTAVPGTWGWKRRHATEEWFNPTSPFTQFLAAHGFIPARPDTFLWSTDINGASGWRRWVPWVNRMGDHTDWHAGGLALRWYLERFPAADRTLIAHSHGGQVALYAAAEGLRIPVLVTVATPVRKDMRAVVARARPNIGAWLHLHATTGDWMQRFGSIGDGVIGLTRQQRAADWNHSVPAVNHTRLLNDSTVFPLWARNGWLELIASEAQRYVA